jgi:hypothetical protein
MDSYVVEMHKEMESWKIPSSYCFANTYELETDMACRAENEDTN